LRRSNRLGNFLVRQSFSYTQREHFSLSWRQPLHRAAQPSFRFVGEHRVQRIVLGGRVSLLNLRAIPSPLLRPSPVEQQTPLDRKQPRSKRALPAKPFDRVEGSNEGILHQ